MILQATHRGGDFGHYHVKEFNEAQRFALIDVTVPYPTVGLKGVEVSGQIVLSFIHALEFGKDERIRIFKENGIVNPTEDSWHRQLDVLDALREMEESFGPKTLYLLGATVMQNIQFPFEIKSISDSLEALGEVLKISHRGGDYGHSEVLGYDEEKRVVMIDTSLPYPTNGLIGYYTGLARKTGPKPNLKVEVIDSDVHDNAHRQFCLTW